MNRRVQLFLLLLFAVPVALAAQAGTNSSPD